MVVEVQCELRIEIKKQQMEHAERLEEEMRLIQTIVALKKPENKSFKQRIGEQGATCWRFVDEYKRCQNLCAESGRYCC